MLPVIPAGPVVLRPPSEADADAITRACGDPQIARFLPRIPSPYTRDDALAWITKAAPADVEAGGADFVIAGRATGEVLGLVALHAPDRLGGREVGYWLAPWARGRGVMTTAVRAIAEWGFAQGLPRISLLAAVENVPSQQVALRAGFEREGVLRGAQPRRDGTRGDMAAFARLADDPGEPISSSLPFFPGGFRHGELTDGVVRLTPLMPSDAADYHALQCLPDVVASHVPPVVPVYAESETICRYAGHRWLSGHRADIAVRDAKTGALAGDLQLTAVNPGIGQAMVGYCLRPGFRGRGLMTRALTLLVDWAFTSTSLGRIFAGTDPANTASHRVLERAGFTREALLKGLLPGPDGTRLDDLQWVRLSRPQGTGRRRR